MAKARLLGLTLIEVLIAMAIISIAMTAMIKTTAQTIHNTRYLQTRVYAHWVAMYVLHAAEKKILPLPTTDGEVKMLNQNWQWQGFSANTKNPHIHEIHITVTLEGRDHPLAEAVSYQYAP